MLGQESGSPLATWWQTDGVWQASAWLDGRAVGLEAGPLSQWLYDGLHEGGLEPVLLQTRHAKAALSAMRIKFDCFIVTRGTHRLGYGIAEYRPGLLYTHQ